MDTKEAINWIFDIWHEWENVYGISGEQNLKEGKKMDEVIELLKRGEKYEAMWNDLWEGLEFKSNKDLLHMNYEDFVNYMKEIKQKYFLKEDIKK